MEHDTSLDSPHPGMEISIHFIFFSSLMASLIYKPVEHRVRGSSSLPQSSTRVPGQGA